MVEAASTPTSEGREEIPGADEERWTLTAADGYELAASFFAREDAPQDAPMVIVASATGVKRSYYADFARFLAGHGLRAATLDYRGIGDSAPEDLRTLAATKMQDWGELDLAALVDALTARYPSAPLGWVGHSFGGQALGLVGRPERIGAAVLVASQSGNWRLWPVIGWPRLWLFWYALVPLTTALKGYFPGSSFGLGEDLPAGVARQWARWCRRRRYLLGGETARQQQRTERFQRVRAALRAYTFSDDTFAPRAAAVALLGFYPPPSPERDEERWEHRHLRPEDLGQHKVGHFGPFRKALRSPLWEDIARWLTTELGIEPAAGHNAEFIAEPR